MKRSEFNLLVENWRKFLKDGVIQEQNEDFDYYADEIEKQPEVRNAQDDFDFYAGEIDQSKSNVDNQADSDVETTNKNPFEPGEIVHLFNIKQLEDYDTKIEEKGSWKSLWFEDVPEVVIMSRIGPDEKGNFSYEVSEDGHEENRLKYIPEKYLTRDEDYAFKQHDRRLQGEYLQGQAQRDQNEEQNFAANNSDSYYVGNDRRNAAIDFAKSRS